MLKWDLLVEVCRLKPSGATNFDTPLVWFVNTIEIAPNEHLTRVNWSNYSDELTM